METEDVKVNVHTLVIAYVHPFKLGEKLARIDALIPVSFARWEGLLSGLPASTERNGLADPRIRFSLHLKGPPAMEAAEMKKYLLEHRKYTTIGVSVAITVPLGQYNDERLLNLGLNQFVFRPQLGMLHNWGLWSFELTASVFIFTKNNDFFNDSDKRQDPLFAAQAHLIKRFTSRHWISVSTGYGLGGQSVVNRQSNNDVRSNFLGAASFGIPIGKKQSAKFTYIRQETLKDIGADTNSLILGWSLAF
ncbi:MAG: transporter [Flavobacteriaceae bacterium]